MNHTGMKTNNLKEENEINHSAMKTNDFKSQSGMKIQNGIFNYYCTKCHMPSPAKFPGKCPMGGFHVWAKIY